MGDLDSAINSLSDQTKKIDIALHFVNGDIDKAKQMVANAYKDLYVLKGRFSSLSQYGSFIIFYNYVYLKVEDSFWAVSPDYSLFTLNNADEWTIFEKAINEARKMISDVRYIAEFKDKIEKAMNISFSKKLVKLLEDNDATQLTHHFVRLLKEAMNLQKVELNIDYQKVSSLDMELLSISNRKLESKAALASQSAEQSAKQPSATEKAEPEVGKDGIKLIIKSTLILAPVKGKHISLLKVGDRVMVSMIEKTTQTVQVAKAFNAYNSERQQLMPIVARIKQIDYVDGTGYIVYAVIAKGILAHIIEEETNIKVAMDPAYQALKQSDAEEPSKVSLPLIIGLVAVILSLIAFIVIMIM